MLKKSWFTFIVVVAIMSMLSTAHAFDGQRKGFILGFGLGPGVTSFTQTLAVGGYGVTSDRQNEFGIHTDFKIGAGIDEQLQVYWISRVAWFSMDNVLGTSVTVANGIGGAGISYYLLPQSPSWYLTGGLGISTWSLPFEDNTDSWYGLGITGGVGYEFSPHWSVEFSLAYGNPSKDMYGITAKSNALSVKACINALAY